MKPHLILKLFALVASIFILSACGGGGGSDSVATDEQTFSPDDVDNDGLSNDVELANGLDPNDPSDGYYADTDGDLIVNGLEIEHGLDFRDSSDAALDNDNDGLTNLQELNLGLMVFDYDATRDGALLDNGWTIHNTRDGDTYTLVDAGEGKRQQLRNLAASSNPYFHTNLSLADHIDTLYTEGGTYTQRVAFFGNGAYFHIEVPAEDNFTGNMLALGIWVAPAEEANQDLSFSLKVGGSIREQGVLAGKYNNLLHTIKIVFDGNNSFAGSIYVDDELVVSLSNIFITTTSAQSGFYFASGSSATNRGFDLSSVNLLIGSDATTNPNLADTDNDGFSDQEELVHHLNPNDPSDGPFGDSDNDGVDNGTELAQGFDPLDSDDLVGEDTDGDGFTTAQEINAGLDPFSPDDPFADNDDDGLSNAQEVEYLFNANDPNDGYNGDADQDGVSNGEEIANNTNPNDHKIKVNDEFTTALVVLDMNGDGQVNDSDQALDVSFTRYSMRKDTTHLWTFDDTKTPKYTKQLIFPETRTFRGRIVDYPDSAVFATVWPNCTITYFVFAGYNTAPNFKLSADDAYYFAWDKAFDHEGICNQTDESDARFQGGLQVSYEPSPHTNMETNPDLNYWPSADAFHLYEKPQSIQASYQAYSQNINGAEINKDIEAMVALIEHHQNIADQFTTRSFLDRITISDILVEVTGLGYDDTDGDHAPWDDNWPETRANFWAPRRSGHQYWYEHVYWNHPNGAQGLAYGERVMNKPTQGSTTTYSHEMGHNYGSGHESFGERYKGHNAMRGHAPTHATIVHQGEALDRRASRERANINQETDLRIVAESNWNYHPLAQPDHTSVYRNESANIDVLSNDSDSNNDALTVKSVHIEEEGSSAGAGQSSISVNQDGQTIDFTPPAGFIGLVEAYYVLEDARGLSSRGILHINVEHNGISDVFTFDHECVEDPNPNGLFDMFKGNSKDSNLLVRNWGYKTAETDEAGEVITAGCTENTITGLTGHNDHDHGVDFQLTQAPFFNNELNDEPSSGSHYHPHLFEINDKDFTASFWYRPNADTDGYYELARRGRVAGTGWDDDGWVIAQDNDTLIVQIHEKSKLAKDGRLRFEVPGRSELLDSSSWVHIAMTLDWTNRSVKVYIDGELASGYVKKGAGPGYINEVPVNEMTILDHFSLVSTSGTGHTYGRGAYAAFGQANAAYNTQGNNGVDDVVVAHKALTAAEIENIYLQKLPAYSPQPTNGESVDIAATSMLSWNMHPNLNLQFSTYRVYLSDNASAVENREESAWLGSTSNNFYDISAESLSANTAYYWAVDIELQNLAGTIEGEVWSFWEEQQELMAFSAFVLRTPAEYHGPEAMEEDYEGDTAEFNHDH